MSALIWVRHRNFALIRTAHPGLHLTRNVFHFTGQNLWFYGLTMIPLSQLVALEFTMPIWVLLLILAIIIIVILFPEIPFPVPAPVPVPLLA